VAEKGVVPEKNLVIVFPTTHLTLKAESILEQAEVMHRTVMKPRKISSDCGLAIRVNDGDLQHIRDLLDERSVEPLGYFVESDGAWEPVSMKGDR
jgi:hypothetical protein